MNEIYVLILTIVGSTSQSGQAIHSIEFSTRATCESAKAEWLRDYPKYELRHKSYYIEGRPRAICVKK